MYVARSSFKLSDLLQASAMGEKISLIPRLPKSDLLLNLKIEEPGGKAINELLYNSLHSNLRIDLISAMHLEVYRYYIGTKLVHA